MTLRLERLATEGAGRPSGTDEDLGTPHERARRRRIDPHAQQVRSLVGIVRQLGILAVLGRGLCLDNDRLASCVPGQRHGTYPEELHDRLLERDGVSVRGRLRRVDRIEQEVQALGQGRDLHLLDADADEGTALSRLEVELPRARLADGAGNESVGVVEDEEPSCHRAHRSVWRAGTVLVQMSTTARS
jgi:hypothetical protein